MKEKNSSTLPSDIGHANESSSASDGRSACVPLREVELANLEKPVAEVQLKLSSVHSTIKPSRAYRQVYRLLKEGPLFCSLKLFLSRLFPRVIRSEVLHAWLIRRHCPGFVPIFTKSIIKQEKPRAKTTTLRF